MAGTTESQRAKKGKIFSSEEEQQVCRSFLCISQDPVIGNGQHSGTFWERVAEHYNQNRPTTGGGRFARSLETKWGSIKHDVAKFVEVYKQVHLCRKSGYSLDNILKNALELYKVKHPKQQSFIFLHCWLLVGDVPRSMESVLDTRQRLAARVSPSSKHKTAPTDTDGDEDCGGLPPSSMFEDPGAQSPGSCTTSAPSRRFKLPVGQKIAKLDLRPRPWSPLSSAHSLAPWTAPMKTATTWMLQPSIHTLHLSVAISATNSAAMRRCIHARFSASHK